MIDITIQSWICNKRLPFSMKKKGSFSLINKMSFILVIKVQVLISMGTKWEKWISKETVIRRLIIKYKWTIITIFQNNNVFYSLIQSGFFRYVPGYSVFLFLYILDGMFLFYRFHTFIIYYLTFSCGVCLFLIY